MAYLSLRERLKIPVYDRETEMSWSEVSIDNEMCDGCGVCVKICPSSALRLVGKGKEQRVRMIEGYHNCIGCNDCSAICEKDAIAAAAPMECTLYFKTLDHGSLTPPRRY